MKDEEYVGDSDVELNISEGSERFWRLVAAIAICITIAVAMMALSMAVRAMVRKYRAADSPVPPTAKAAQEIVDTTSWTDASRFSIKSGNVALKIERAFFGAVRVRDLRGETVTTDNDKLLGITVLVRNRGTRSRPFADWYGHAFVDQRGNEMLAELVDDQQRGYPLLKFDDALNVEGQRHVSTIDPDHTAQDTVVFLIADDVDRQSITYFRLTLPGPAVGMESPFRFMIPVSMIDGF